MASVWASAARELLHTLVSRFDAQSITVSGNGFPLLISSVLATKINQPPWEEPSGLVAQLASQYIPNLMRCNGPWDLSTKWVLAVSFANLRVLFTSSKSEMVAEAVAD